MCCKVSFVADNVTLQLCLSTHCTDAHCCFAATVVLFVLVTYVGACQVFFLSCVFCLSLILFILFCSLLRHDFTHADAMLMKTGLWSGTADAVSGSRQRH